MFLMDVTVDPWEVRRIESKVDLIIIPALAVCCMVSRMAINCSSRTKSTLLFIV